MHILIVGGSRGLGLELLKRFCEAGQRVTSLSRSPSVWTHSSGNCFEHVQLDVTDFDQVSHFFQQTDQIFDFVLHLAGRSSVVPFLLQSNEFMSDMIKLNILAPMVLAREYFRYCIGRGIAGNLVEFSSSVITSDIRGESLYAATKAAIEEMVKKQALEIADFGLSICAVRLGLYNIGLGANLNRQLTEIALRRLNQKDYRSVDKLYSQLTSILKMQSGSRNGMIFEIE